jgi:vancomycin resistance protein VanJ
VIRRTLSLLIFGAGLGWLALILLARSGASQQRWPLELLDTFAPYAFAPLLALGPLALLLRSRALFALGAVALVAFGLQFGHLFLPRPAIAAGSGPSLRVLTNNVLGTRNDARALAELVRVEQPDVIVLQELTEDFAADFRRRTGDAYPYRALDQLGDGNDGSGTFSRLPILEARTFRVVPDGNYFQRLRLDLGGASLTLFNAHPASPGLRTQNPPGPIPRMVRGFGSPTREEELRWLFRETEKLSGPYILAGDFNVAAGSRPYRQFPARWRDAFAQAGWGFGHTFPTRYPLHARWLTITIPLVRIDYILTSPELTASRAWVPWIEGSDHLPVMAELHLVR